MKTIAMLLLVLLAIPGQCAYLGSWGVGDTITLSRVTANPLTAESIATATPTYRIYEDAGDTALASGSMSRIDSLNTWGAWRASVVLAATSGFESGKSYTVIFRVVVSDATYESADSFQIGAEVSASSLWGAGALQYVYTLTSSVDETPIADAQVWVTTDEAGLNIIAAGTTDQYGQVTFQLDAGTVYIWRAKTGWTFINPEEEAVSE